MPKKNDPFRHVPTIDPSREWATTFEFFLRLRGIVTAVVIEIGTSAAIWSYLGVSAGIAAVIVAVSMTLMLYWARNERLRSVKRDNQLHNILHFTRDHLAKIHEIDGRSKTKLKSSLDSFHHEIVEHLATYFRCDLNSADIGCALRLAENVKGEPCYVTYARSKGLEEIRERQSKPLPAGKGLAQALRSKEMKGVFIIDCIQSAAEVGLWELSPNDDLRDVRSLMVAPINTIEGGRPGMIGILYITAQKPIFKNRHTISLKAFADLLGLVYPILFAKMGAKLMAR